MGLSGGNLPPGQFPVPGNKWGKYLIEKQLGEGGQAVVFQAFDQLGPAGHVALKVPHRPVPGSMVQAWIDAEVRPLTRLQHPNIVQVVDAGCVDEVPYVATRLVDGVPLGAYVKTRAPRLKEIRDWMMHLTDAVAAAHDQHIVHRDIKPQNILMTTEGRPMVVDFGIASLISAYRTDPEGSSWGTPPFMAPEQARGEVEADHRVDVFALGGVLKFLLDGTGPYGKTHDARQEAREGRIQRADATAGPWMRRALARIANRAIEADPKDRYASAHEMVRALRGVRTRRRLLAVAASAAALAAVTGVVMALRPPLPAGPSTPAPQRLGQEARDAWTRQHPVSMVILVSKSTGSRQEGEDERLIHELTSKMLEGEQFKVVERAELDLVLKEHQLSASSLADQESALRVGRLLSAHAIVFAAIDRSPGKTRVSLRTVDTETTQVCGFASAETEGPVSAEVVARLAAGLARDLTKSFPVRGRIARRTGDTVELNIGRKAGVRPDMVLAVLSDDDPSVEIGRLRVTRVLEQSAVAEILSTQGPVRELLRVQAQP